MCKRTPDSFVLIDVKIVIFLKKMNQFDVFDNFLLSMSERAKTFVITIFDIIGIKLTEFGFVTIGMVELLQLIMGKLAILVVAFLFFAIKMTVDDI